MNRLPYLITWSPFTTVGNFGDELTHDVVRFMLERKGIDSSKAPKNSLAAIGSVLTSDGVKNRGSVITVWGSGGKNQVLSGIKLDLRAVRGPKTAAVLKRGGRVVNDIPQIDPAYLAPLFIKPLDRPQKVVLVPHIFDGVTSIAKAYDLLPSEVEVVLPFDKEAIQKIASAEVVVSSALHGLIIADAYGLPFVPLKPTKEPTWKYEDWADSLGVNLKFWNPKETDDWHRYVIQPSDRSLVQEKTQQLMDAFPYDLWDDKAQGVQIEEPKSQRELVKELINRNRSTTTPSRVVKPGDSSAISFKDFGGKLEVLDPGVKLTDGSNFFNPSITHHDGKTLILLKNCNVKPDKNGNYNKTTNGKKAFIYNWIGDFDLDSREVTNLKKLEIDQETVDNVDSLCSGVSKAQIDYRKSILHLRPGGGDARIVSRGGELRLFSTFPHDPYGQSKINVMTEWGVDLENGLTKLLDVKKSPTMNVRERNWTPPTRESKVFELIYAPGMIYKDGVVSGEKYDGYLHGGTHLVWVPSERAYFAILHRYVGYDRPRTGRRYYVQFLTKWNTSGKMTHISKPFKFDKNNMIEFESGMIFDEVKKEFVITYGIEDEKPALASISLENFKKALVKYESVDQERFTIRGKEW